MTSPGPGSARVTHSLLEWDLGNVPPGIPWGGVDEAGRGAWAGPVVAACAVLDPETVRKWRHVLDSARDSKRLPPGRRSALAEELKVVLPAWGVAVVDNVAIDRDNILEASLAAMRQSVSRLSTRPRLLLVDGDRAPRTGLPERLLVEGDARSCAVACASILAKTHRDALMVALDGEFPGYGFARHKGYGTPEHRRALAALGTACIHRLTYAPVAALQRPDEGRLGDLRAALGSCVTVIDLQTWVEGHLRPAYGLLRPAWVEELRHQYGQRLLVAVRTEAGA
jgi:ribonuclease HII